MGICDEHAPPSADRTRGPKIELYLGDFNQLVQQAEAIILLTPLGRGHDPGLLAPLLDLLPDDAFAGKPVLLVATGGPSEHVSELQQTYAAEFRRLQANLLQPPLHIGSRAWINRRRQSAQAGPCSDAGEFIGWLTIKDPRGAVVTDVRRLRSHPLVPATIPIHGYLYDVKTGRLVEVPEATTKLGAAGP